MTDEERQAREALYTRISDAVLAAVESCPGAAAVPPEGFQSLLSGISQVWGRKGTPGVMIRTGKDGLVVDVSVALASASALTASGRKLQAALWEAVRTLGADIEAVNIDILKIEK